MTRPIPRTCIAIGAVFLTTSCREDPELVKKHSEQQAEIAKLNGELIMLEERLKNVPPDQSAELNKTAAEADKLEAEHDLLSSEVAALEAEHKALLQKYADYKRKYAIR